jgi:UDP-N-acetylmuramyl pentapeptide phosphotransferase/UDP-N-acetylglucosamine-1-phosphate transferase
MILLISAVFFSALVTYISIPAIIKIAKLKKLNDIPSERKLHQLPVPALGGISIFISLSLSTIFFLQTPDEFWIKYFIGSLLIIFFLGLKDDLIPLSPYKKFAGQILAISLLIYFGGIKVDSLFGFFGVHNLSNFWANCITGMLFLVIINSFNLIDGVDGLAGTLGLISSSIFGFLFLFNSNLSLATISFCLSSSTLVFLTYNYSPAKIFLGDTGSMIIGFINAFLAVKLLNCDISLLNNYSVTNLEVIIFSLFFIPFFDTSRVFVIRISKGKSPFHPDLNHIHHLLLARGFTHTRITLILGGFSVLLLLIGYYLQKLGINLIFLTFIFLGLIFVSILRTKSK